MVIGESDFRHQVADDIRPFRDVLLGLFFATVGMQVDPTIVGAQPLHVLAWIMIFLPGKALLTALAATLMRWRAQVRARLAIILTHSGEFGLLLLTQAIASGVVTAELGQPALVALVLSMVLAPLLIQHSDRLVRRLGSALEWQLGREHDAVRAASSGLADHVLICGCGRIGRLVVAALEAAQVGYLAIESDLARVEAARKQGHRVVFGDAARLAILESAGLANAKLLVVTFDRRPAVERVLHFGRGSEPRIPALVSAADEEAMPALMKFGATTVFPENLAAGLALAHQALVQGGFTQQDAAEVITRVRAKLNPELRDMVGI